MVSLSSLNKKKTQNQQEQKYIEVQGSKYLVDIRENQKCEMILIKLFPAGLHNTATLLLGFHYSLYT